MKVKRTCLECGKLFEVYQSAVDRGEGKFCTSVCGYENKRVRVDLICAWCGKEFQKRKSNAKKVKIHFCCKACDVQWRSENLRGERSSQFGKTQSAEHIERRIQRGKNHYRWNGGVKIQNGYRFIKQKDGSYKQEHRIIAEKALGRLLNQDEHVHHINGDRIDNRNENLLICDIAYHSWLHRTQENFIMFH